MNQQASIQNIAKYLGRFVHEVKANNTISLFDINKLAENVVVPIFREIFDCPDLENLNLEQGNFPGVDLGDKARRIAFQITSTAANDKIRHTLEKFTKYNLNEQYDVLYVYILTEKLSYYADKNYAALLDNHIHFDKNRHILDYTDLMKRIDAITDYEKIKRVEALLEGQFIDRKAETLNANASLINQLLHHMSFEGQMEKYLDRQIADFKQKYSNGDKYINLNGKILERLVTGIFEDESTGIKKGYTWNEDPYSEPVYESENVLVETKFVTYKPLDKFINQWLRDKRSRLLIIMGEYGTGKTTFSKHITYQLASQHRVNGDSILIRDEKRRIPLLLPLRKFNNSIENFVTQCSNDYGITTLNYSELKHQINEDKLLVIFDGFDEMTQRTDSDEKRVNFSKLNDLLEESPNSKFILTCREEYFLTTEELHNTFRCDANLEIVHLLPLDEEQIKQFLRTHTDNPEVYWEQIDKTFDLKDLAKRPVLLELIINYLPKLLQEKKGKRIQASDLYKTCIDEELIRVKKKFETILPVKARLELLKCLAAWIYTNDTLSFDTRKIGEELKLREFFKVQNVWEYDGYLNEFLTFTFLLREGDYQFRISHKSFRDYLTALVLVDEINSLSPNHIRKVKVSGEIQSFICEHNLNQDYLLVLVKAAKTLTEGWQGTNAANVLVKINPSAFQGQNLSECYLQDIEFRFAELKETNFQNAYIVNSDFSNSLIEAEGLSDANFINCSLRYNIKSVTSLQGIEKIRGLNQLDCAINEISDLTPISEFFYLQRLDCQHNRISDISPITELEDLRYLACFSNQIENISPVAKLKNLSWFFFEHNEVSDLTPISELTNLLFIICDYNKITDISPICKLTNLQRFRCSFNLIEDISPIGKLDSILELSCNGNEIKDISPLKKHKNLKYLDCGINQIKDLSPIKELSNLETLTCDNNQIKKLPLFSNIEALQYLYCHKNLIKKLLPISELRNLKRLYCHYNKIKDLNPISNLTNLLEFNCSNNSISDISPIRELKNLQQFYCSNNEIKDLSPISGLLNLQQLSFENNQVIDLSPLKKLTNLRYLKCDKNPIVDLTPIMELKNLKILHLSKNQFEGFNLLKLKEAIPELKIELV